MGTEKVRVSIELDAAVEEWLDQFRELLCEMWGRAAFVPSERARWERAVNRAWFAMKRAVR